MPDDVYREAPGDADTLSPEEVGTLRRGRVLARFPAGTRLGEYEIVSVAGMGAMGVVFRARSLRVGHDVALKVLLDATSPETVARFRREASAAARLAGHPGIAAVHDQGETDGVAWLAMEYVPGRTFRELIESESLSLDAALDLIEQAARAVAHAHTHGVLHRDLKPGNILITGLREAGGGMRPLTADRTPHTDLRAKVTDFGLAGLIGDGSATPRLTRAGTTLGTPAYMPPEQALGQPTDARADVYALGATLLHAVTGHSPFGDASAEVMFDRLVAGDLPAIDTLRPDLPRGVHAVLARAMASAPDDRYPTAAAFADDLARLRRGQAVTFRAGRSWRALARGRRGVALAGAVVGLVALTAWLQRWRAGVDAGVQATIETVRATGSGLDHARRATDVHVLLVQRATEALRALEDHARGVRLGTAAVSDHLAAIDAAAAEAAARAPESAIPDAWRGLARVLSGAAPEGHALLVAAAARAGDDPFPALLSARAALAEWTESLALPDLSYDERVGTGALVESDAMRAARGRAQASLAQALASPLWPAMTQARDLQRYADGVSAITGQAPARAAELLGPLRDDPMLGAEAALLHGLARFVLGSFSEAAADWGRLGARGWRAAGLWSGVAWGAAAIDVGTAGGDAQPLYAAGVSALDTALARHPGWAEARHKRAQLRQMQARDLFEHGGDASELLTEALAGIESLLADAPGHLPALETRAQLRSLAADSSPNELDPAQLAAWRHGAIADYDRVLAADPDAATAVINRGVCRRRLALAEIAAGRPAEGLVSQALADLDRGIALRPGSLAARLVRAQVLTLRAAEAGSDSMSLLRLALADLDATERELGASYHLHVVRGSLLDALGTAAAERGGDARAAFRAAIAAYEAAVAADARRPLASGNLGLACRNLARALRAAGDDPGPVLEQGLAALDRAIELAPGSAAVLSNRVLLHVDLAEVEADRGRDTAPHLARALADADAAVAASPRFASALANRGLVQGRLAEVDARSRRDPWPRLAAALADHSGALDLEPHNLEARNGRALLYKQRAALLAGRGDDPRPELAHAIDDFARVLEAQPGHLAALSNRGTARMDLAAAGVARGGDPRPHLAAARADFDAALARNPDYLPARLNRGSACQNEADVAARRGEDAGPWLERALADFVGVCERNPRYWRAWSGRGWLLQRLGRLPEAAEAYERSLAINPSQDFIRDQLAKVRSK